LRRFSERFARFGFPSTALRPVYGLSEATLAVTFSPPRSLATLHVDTAELGRSGRVSSGHGVSNRELVSLGVPAPGAEVEVRGTDGRSLEEGRQGRVFVRSPSVMEGYFGSPEASGAAFSPDGWLDTGDLGFVHGGELFLTGRTKDLIIIRGANHAPQEFEDCLDDLPGVRVGCVVALGFTPPGSEEEALLLLVEQGKERTPHLADAVREAVMARTAICPHTVEILAPGTLPRTSSGKLRRQKALRQYLTGQLRPPREVNAFTLGWEAVRSSLAFARTRQTP
jgi:acyl-CoA synthetase (AMP-forming)/AMP-acid ligase II